MLHRSSPTVCLGLPPCGSTHTPKVGIKNLQGATELELNFSARRPIKWAAYELFSRSETVQVPGGNMPPVHRPPGAASTFLILPCSVTRSRQRTVPVIGYRSDGSAGAAKPPGIPYPQAARAISFYLVPSVGTSCRILEISRLRQPLRRDCSFRNQSQHPALVSVRKTGILPRVMQSKTGMAQPRPSAGGAGLFLDPNMALGRAKNPP